MRLKPFMATIAMAAVKASKIGQISFSLSLKSLTISKTEPKGNSLAFQCEVKTFSCWTWLELNHVRLLIAWNEKIYIIKYRFRNILSFSLCLDIIQTELKNYKLVNNNINVAFFRLNYLYSIVAQIFSMYIRISTF